MKESIGQIIRRLRKERNLTQEELAKHEPGSRMSTPLLNEVEYDFYWSYGQTKEKLLLKLQNPAFETLRDDEQFATILKRAEACIWVA